MFGKLDFRRTQFDMGCKREHPFVVPVVTVLLLIGSVKAVGQLGGDKGRLRSRSLRESSAPQHHNIVSEAIYKASTSHICTYRVLMSRT